MLINNNKIESIGEPVEVIKQFRRLFTDQKSDLKK
jgi:hypothetical protein